MGRPDDYYDYRSQKKEMTNEEARHHIEFLIKGYQNLIDNDIRSGDAIGKDVEGQWSADTTLRDAYQTMIDALDIALSWEP